jgi:hypothetical protein
MADVLRSLDTAWCTLETVADQSCAAQGCVDLLAKARRAVPLMVLAIADYQQHVQQTLDAAEWPHNVRSYVAEVALPAAYLRRVSASASDAAMKRAHLERSEALLSHCPDETQWMAPEERCALWKWVEQCAGEFCRGTSCVEGRNGVLSLRHHAYRRLLPKKRAALTVAHNFLSTRQDGTTAAQRFFEQPHPHLFKWLLKRMPDPPRPAKRAKKAISTVPVA